MPKTINYTYLEAVYTDGRQKRQEWIRNLKKIDLFDSFEIDDNFLSAEERKLLLSKLTYEAGRVPEQYFADFRNGLQEIQGNPVYVMGEHILPDKTYPGFPKIITHDTMKPIKYADKQEIAQHCCSYISLLPGTTEILFYASLFAVIKPFLGMLGIPSGFLLLLAAPPGHLKLLWQDFMLYGMSKRMHLKPAFMTARGSRPSCRHLSVCQVKIF